jgi:hypothetical protein
MPNNPTNGNDNFDKHQDFENPMYDDKMAYSQGIQMPPVDRNGKFKMPHHKY